MTLTADSIDSLGKFQRIQLATSLPEAKPICLVGTKSAAGVTNLAPDGSIDLVHSGSLTSTALDTYYSLTKVARLPYANR